LKTQWSGWIELTKAKYLMEGPNKSGLPEKDTTASALIQQIQEIDDFAEAKKLQLNKDTEKQTSMLDAAHNTIMDNMHTDIHQSARDKRKKRHASDMSVSTPSSTSSSDVCETPEQFGRTLLDMINKPQQLQEDFKLTLLNDEISIKEFVVLIACNLTEEALVEFANVETAVLVAIYNGTENSIMKFRTEMQPLRFLPKLLFPCL
jgi:hypothetical protein